MMPRRFESLSSREVMALAIHIEQSNARPLRSFADVFRGYDQAVTARFEEMAGEEHEREVALAEFAPM